MKFTSRQSRVRRSVESLVEVLEDRRLLSASAIIPAPTSSTVLHEPKGVKFTADLGTFVTIAPGTGLDVSIDWGDGSNSTGVLKSDGPVGVDEIKFEVDGTHKYKSAGTYAIDVSVDKPGPPPTTYIQQIASFEDKAVVARGNTLLNGSISGTYVAAPVVVLPNMPTAVTVGAEYIFKGSGSAGDLGPVSATGELTLPPPSNAASSPTGTLTLDSISTSAKKSGTVTLKLTGPTENSGDGIPSTLTYQITAGTGIFTGASGFGTIDVILDPNGTGTFTFDITSGLPPQPV